MLDCSALLGKSHILVIAFGNMLTGQFHLFSCVAHSHSDCSAPWVWGVM